MFLGFDDFVEVIVALIEKLFLVHGIHCLSTKY
jgi:hypothetical protein